VPDFAILRANGDPLYTLTNPLDDAMMGITHVLRGEDLLSSTPRQIPLYRTLQRLGVGNGPPRFGHLPMVMGEGNRKLSKRDPGSGLLEYVDRGFLPEGLLNYLALLGWGIAEDRDVFTMQEMAEAFDIRRVNPNPARFDMKKLEAINSAHMRRISLPDMTERVIPFLAEAELVHEPITRDERRLLDAAMPLVHERINTLSEAVPMLGFLFVDEASFARLEEIEEHDLDVVRAAYDALSGLGEWTTGAIEQSLRDALVERMGLKPRNAFGPVRVAVTGSRVSPPLFESLELLGRERSLGRLQAALA
jgi:glutamyl-tRNA synthetase